MSKKRHDPAYLMRVVAVAAGDTYVLR